MSVIEKEKTVESYKDEIKEILTKVRESFKNEQMYNYELLERYEEVEKDFKDIENNNIVEVYENVKQLLG
ncbi:hypothetical protein COE51_16275 [Bacillus pseudomycoides]|nr:hypothetical protein COE51_16275 [Bacillus pseudomycoides]